jgi:hypothetical protein
MYSGYGDAVEVGASVLGLLIPTILANIPLLVICIIARHRLGPRGAASIVAIGFVAACAWWLRGAWREGVPSTAYLTLAYVPSLVAIGLIGWFVGRVIGRDFELSVPQAPDDFTRLTR